MARKSELDVLKERRKRLKARLKNEAHPSRRKALKGDLETMQIYIKQHEDANRAKFKTPLHVKL